MSKKSINSVILSDLHKLTESLNYDNGSIHKKNVLNRDRHLEDLLTIIYNKNFKFNITGDNVKEHYESENFSYVPTEKGLITLLFDLKNKVYSGNFALDMCASLLHNNKEFETLVLNVFNKDLKCGINTKTLEKAYGKTISSFPIPLANKYKKGICDFDNEDWYASRKLDGIRCVIVKTRETINAFSRTGKKLHTLDRITDELLFKYPGMNFVLDGEVCLMDEKGNESFQGIMKEIRRKNHTIERPMFFVFDFWTVEEFEENKDKIPFFYKALTVSKGFLKGLIHISFLEQFLIIDKEDFKDKLRTLPKEWEGLMLRKNDPSLFKRSNSLLKVKEFKEKEYKVAGCIFGTKMIKGELLHVCSSIEIRHKNNPVHVGSGLSDEQRISWEKDPESIMGRIVTIKYFEETKNQKGKYSLRFPVLKIVHGNERTL